MTHNINGKYNLELFISSAVCVCAFCITVDHTAVWMYTMYTMIQENYPISNVPKLFMMDNVYVTYNMQCWNWLYLVDGTHTHTHTTRSNMRNKPFVCQRIKGEARARTTTREREREQIGKSVLSHLQFIGTISNHICSSVECLLVPHTNQSNATELWQNHIQ